MGLSRQGLRVGKTSAMPNVVSALSARTQLGQILRRVKTKNERFVVDRHDCRETEKGQKTR